MKQSLIVLAAVSFAAGCGVDTTSTAATAAALKKQEIEQGQKNKEYAQRKIEQAVEQMQQSAQKAADAAEGN